jgi:glucoamylase
VIRIFLAIAAVALVAASVSGASEQPPQPLSIALPAAAVPNRLAPLGPGAPPWARRLYRRSVQVLLALTDSRTGGMIAGRRDGWDYVWPRDAAAGALALEAAGLRPQARHVAGFLERLHLGDAARFYPDGGRVPGRPEAGDAAGWVAAASRGTRAGRVPAGTGRVPASTSSTAAAWRSRQDYGENVTGDLLGNAIASGTPTAEVRHVFLGPRGLTREPGGEALDSSAAWAVTVFPQPGLRSAARRTLLAFARESTPYGIPPIEAWTPGQVWTAPTAWSAWALAELGETRAADRLLGELRRAETPYGTLPERVDARTGRPMSTTPLAWSHAFAILALRARYPG